MSEIGHRICPVCEAGCGLEIAHEGRAVTGIRGAKDDILSRGFVCPKGAALKELDADPDRLRQPLVRRNGKLEPATWSEAFAAVKAGLLPILDKYGRDSAAVYVGNPTAHNYELALGFGIFARALGSPYVFTAGTVDQTPKQVACGLMFGSPMAIPVPDIDRCDYILMLGANPIVSNGSLWMVPDFRGRLREMKQRGGRLVVIDPRRSETAEIADRHHAIRPGTDAWLLLGILHAMLDAGATPPAHLADLLDGFDALADLARQVTPAQAADICGIPAGAIETLARELLETPRAAVYGRIGTTAQKHGTVTSWLIEVVNILAGNLDVEGGAMFANPPAFGPVYSETHGPGGFQLHRYRARVTGAPEADGQFPVACMPAEIEGNDEGRIRALVCVAGNPVLSNPNGTRLDKALASLDFLVVTDIYLSETARLANVVLPGTSAFEKGHYDGFLSFFMTRNVARYSPPLFPLGNGAMSEWRMMLALASIVSGGTADDAGIDAVEDAALGAMEAPSGIERPEGLSGAERWLDLELRTGPYPGLTLQKLIDAPRGVDLGALQPRLPGLLRTASGRIELAPPVLVDAARSMLDEPPSREGLRLIGRRQTRSNNSWLHNLPMLAKGPFRCTLLIHPADAERLGVADGALVRLSARTGVIQVQAEIDDSVAPGIVSLPHGWGHDFADTGLGVAAERPGANSNILTDDIDLEPVTGTAVLNGIPVRVEPIAAAA